MAVLRPFRAWRYNLDQIGAVEPLLAPLTEKAHALKQFYHRQEHTIHLSAPRSIPQAVDRLVRWKGQRVLLHDALPGIYPYAQTYTLPGFPSPFTRKGFIALVRLNGSPGSPNAIRYHEDIVPQAAHELMHLLAATRMSVTPTHGLYLDPGFALEPLLDTYLHAPLMTVTDAQGVENRLSVIHHTAQVAQVVAHLKDSPIVLADGHHRMAAAEAFRDQWLRAHPDTPADSLVHYHLMYLTNAAADEARILPTHRVFQLADGLEAPDAIDRLAHFFDIQLLNRQTPAWQQITGLPYTFALLARNQHLRLTLKPGIDPVADNPLDLPASVKRLDYTVLHYFAFDQALGLPYSLQSHADQLIYLKDYNRAADYGRLPGNLAFIVNGVGMDQLLAVTEDGARMPPKSTYFYPKVLTGLVFASNNDTEHDTPFDTGLQFAPPPPTA